MKTKNTYSKLRKEKNTLQHKLNFANQQVGLQIEEIQRLRRVLYNEQKANDSLKSKLELEVKARKRANLKLLTMRIEKNRHYKNFIDEVGKRNKLESYCRASLFSLSVVVLVITVLLIKG